MKKIKKEVPIQPKKMTTNEMLDFLKADKQDAPPREKEIDYKNIPSKRPLFRKWKTKDISDWKSQDFIGYFLNRYLEVLNEECIDFKRSNKYLFMPEKNMANKCLDVVFSNDKQKFKDYIDFIVPWWVSDDSWVSDIPQFRSVFTQKSTFYSVFVSHKNKKTTRAEADAKGANWENWE